MVARKDIGVGVNQKDTRIAAPRSRMKETEFRLIVRARSRKFSFIQSLRIVSTLI
jgi:hypothetical protein